MEQLWPGASVRGASLHGEPFGSLAVCCVPWEDRQATAALGAGACRLKGWASTDLGFRPPSPEPSQWRTLHLFTPEFPATEDAQGLQSLAPSVCWPILYQDCKPSGML